MEQEGSHQALAEDAHARAVQIRIVIANLTLLDDAELTPEATILRDTQEALRSAEACLGDRLQRLPASNTTSDTEAGHE